MNFLELCKRLRQEVGMSGSGPSSVEGQTGEMKRVVDWVSTAWQEIQADRTDWRFMRVPFEVAVTAGTASVILSSTAATIGKQSVICVDARGRWPVEYLEPEEFAYRERREGNPSGRPQYCSLDSDGTIRFMPIPNEDIAVKGDYYRTPQVLSANTDVPLLPERYHMLIVFLGMTYAGAYDEAGNIYADGMNKYNRMMNDLIRDQLPPVRMAGPLA